MRTWRSNRRPAARWSPTGAPKRCELNHNSTTRYRGCLNEVDTPWKRNRIDGERGRNRTFNLVIKSHLLCQLSYAPI